MPKNPWVKAQEKALEHKKREEAIKQHGGVAQAISPLLEEHVPATSPETEEEIPPKVTAQEIYIPHLHGLRR